MRARTLRLWLVASGVPAMGAGAWAAESPDMFMHAVNTNADKTISMAEVDAYAMKRFDTMNHNGSKDATLSMSEIGERMTPADFKAANTVGRSAYPSLSKAEFKAWVNKLFVEADVTVAKGHSAAGGTLSKKELTTPSGKKLIRLLE